MMTLPDTRSGTPDARTPCVPLAPLPRVCEAIENIEDWSSQTVLTLLPIVEACPVLTTTILRAANLPLYGLKNKISTLPHAMAMLGVPALRNLVAGAVKGGALPGEGLQTRMRDGKWRRAVLAASLARGLSVTRAYDLPEEAFVVGLLHDIEDLVFTFRSTEETDDGTLDLETGDAGPSAHFLETCHLPAILVESVRLKDASPDELDELAAKTRELTELLRLAARAAEHLHDDLSESSIQRTAETLEVPVADLVSAVDSALPHLEKTLETLGIPTGSGEITRALDEARTPVGAGGATASPDAKSPALPLQVVRGALRDLRTGGSTDRILDRVMEVAHRKFRFDRVLYFDVEGSGDLIGNRILDDSWRAVDPSEIRLSRNEIGDGLAACLRDKRPAILTPDETTEKLLRLFGVDALGVVPILDDDDVCGALFVDNFYRRHPIGEELMTSLEILCSEAALLLENIKLSSESKELKKFAEKDELTGLNNRRYCIELCRKETERAQRYKTPLTLVMIDVDKFKEINDTLGHQVGDHVLREVARLIEKNSRRSDIIGRYGGDEFVVLLPEIPTEQAIVYAERMRNRVEQLRSDLSETHPEIQFGISLGVGSLAEEDQDFDDLVARVDKALYAAKNRGRNRVCVG